MLVKFNIVNSVTQLPVLRLAQSPAAMAKRLKQANRFETLAKKHATDEIEPSALLEELPQPLSYT